MHRCTRQSWSFRQELPPGRFNRELEVLYTVVLVLADDDAALDAVQLAQRSRCLQQTLFGFLSIPSGQPTSLRWPGQWEPHIKSAPFPSFRASGIWAGRGLLADPSLSRGKAISVVPYR